MKICPVGAKLFHVDRWTDRHTDMMMLIVAFCIFVNMPNNNSGFKCVIHLSKAVIMAIVKSKVINLVREHDIFYYT